MNSRLSVVEIYNRLLLHRTDIFESLVIIHGGKEWSFEGYVTEVEDYL